MVINVAAANLNDHVSVAYVHGLLLNMEMRLVCHKASSLPSDQTTSALFTPTNNTITASSRGGGRQSRGRGRGHQGGHRVSQPPSSNKPTNNVGPSSNRGPPQDNCQICNRVGHVAIDCYHRMDHAY